MEQFYFDDILICPNDPTATKERIKEYRQYYKIKYDICKKQNPRVIAEIGVRAGYSAWTFLQACPKAQYIGFDANNGTHGGQGGEDRKFFKWAMTLLEGYNYNLFEIDTQKVVTLDINNVDFFHVDGDHSIAGVQHDLDLALESISQNGLILIDDITYLDTVKIGVNKWIRRNKKNITHEFIPSLRGEMLIRRI